VILLLTNTAEHKGLLYPNNGKIDQKT
jgi:hypothetical protein